MILQGGKFKWAHIVQARAPTLLQFPPNLPQILHSSHDHDEHSVHLPQIWDVRGG